MRPKYQIDILCWPFHAPKRPGQKYYTILVVIIVYILYIYFRSHFIASRLDRITLYIIRRRPQEKMVKIRDKIKNVTCTEWIHNYILWASIIYWCHDKRIGYILFINYFSLAMLLSSFCEHQSFDLASSRTHQHLLLLDTQREKLCFLFEDDSFLYHGHGPLDIS